MTGQEVVDRIKEHISQCDKFHEVLQEITKDMNSADVMTQAGRKRVLNRFTEISLALRDEYGRWDGLLDALNIKKNNIFDPMVGQMEGSSVTDRKSAAHLMFAEEYSEVNDAMEEATAITSRLKALVGYCDQLGFILNVFYRHHD